MEVCFDPDPENLPTKVLRVEERFEYGKNRFIHIFLGNNGIWYSTRDYSKFIGLQEGTLLQRFTRHTPYRANVLKKIMVGKPVIEKRDTQSKLDKIKLAPFDSLIECPPAGNCKFHENIYDPTPKKEVGYHIDNIRETKRVLELFCKKQEEKGIPIPEFVFLRM